LNANQRIDFGNVGTRAINRNRRLRAAPHAPRERARRRLAVGLAEQRVVAARAVDLERRRDDVRGRGLKRVGRVAQHAARREEVLHRAERARRVVARHRGHHHQPAPPPRGTRAAAAARGAARRWRRAGGRGDERMGRYPQQRWDEECRPHRLP